MIKNNLKFFIVFLISSIVLSIMISIDYSSFWLELLVDLVVIVTALLILVPESRKVSAWWPVIQLRKTVEHQTVPMPAEQELKRKVMAGKFVICILILEIIISLMEIWKPSDIGTTAFPRLIIMLNSLSLFYILFGVVGRMRIKK